MPDHDRTASLMTPAKLAQVKPRVAIDPSAFLDQMAADAGHAHVARLAELRKTLADAGRVDAGPVAAALAAAGQVLPRLDFGLLQPRGWLARMSGKAKTAGAEFAAQHDEAQQALDAVVSAVKALKASQGDGAGRNDLRLVEFEVEFRAIDKIIDQGARWLQDMRAQLKVREAAVPDEAARQQIRADAARCEMLLGRLKVLRAVSSASSQAYEQAKALAVRRAGLVQGLQAAVASDVRDWRVRMEPLASAAGSGDMPALNLEGPMESHRDLQLWIKQAQADCGQLQAHEQALDQAVQVLGLQLDEAA
jgi:hypothetical protein